MTVGIETRRAERDSGQTQKGYIETAINYVSGLSTRAKTGLAAIGLTVALGFGANYALNSEMPVDSPERVIRGQPVGYSEVGRKERLEEQRKALKLDWMSD
ncbi:MAG: hypothetical protein HY512_01225 [Candidatus Aenigmarchaeota archaeon]|nr:hypothetical protein [Candidatus Aenigmarchaeota archaeon]